MQNETFITNAREQLANHAALEFTQQRGGREMRIPILPALQAALDTVPEGQLMFLVTELGKRFTPGGFGNSFRER